MASQSDVKQNPTTLPGDVLLRCTKQAEKDGLFAGLTAGLAGAIVGSRIFRFNRNTTILCGVVTGVLSGYQFSRAFLSSRLARAEAELQEKLNTATPQVENDANP